VCIVSTLLGLKIKTEYSPLVQTPRFIGLAYIARKMQVKSKSELLFESVQLIFLLDNRP
jgi:hypothetical protein